MTRKTLFLTLALLLCNVGLQAQAIHAEEYISIQLPYQTATYTAIQTNLHVDAFGYDAPIASYRWDVYGNGTTILSSTGSSVLYQFTIAGTFTCTVTVTDGNGHSASASMRLQVIAGVGKQYTTEQPPFSFTTLKNGRDADGVCTKYAIIVYAASETDAIYNKCHTNAGNMYDILVNQYGYDPKNVYYLTNTKDADKTNALYKDADSAGNYNNFKSSCTELAGKIDPDDFLVVWLEDHGHGYFKPANFALNKKPNDYIRQGELPGRLYPNASSAVAQHQLLESELQTKPFSGDITIDGRGNHFSGLNKWIYVEYYDTAGVGGKEKPYYFYRVKYGNYDNDPFIERIIDYPIISVGCAGNTTSISTRCYNTISSFTAKYYAKDSFNITVYDSTKEKNWQQKNIIDPTDVPTRNTITRYDPATQQWIQRDVIMHDKNRDGKLDIDLVEHDLVTNKNFANTPQNYDTLKLKIDGTDSNNDGMIDGVDVNEDGNKNTSYGVDGIFYFTDGNLYSTDLAQILDAFQCRNMLVGLTSCFSGGFIKYISKPGRVIFTGTQDQYWGIAGDGLDFSNGMRKDATGKAPADTNGDGNLTMLEIYNFAYTADIKNTYVSSDGLERLSYHQYNDNGDGKQYNASQYGGAIPASISLGCLGSSLTITGARIAVPALGIAPQTVQNTTISTNGEKSDTTVTLNTVSLQTPANYSIHVQDKVLLQNFSIQKGATLTIDNNVCK